MSNNHLPEFKHLPTDALIALHREVGEELKQRNPIPTDRNPVRTEIGLADDQLTIRDLRTRESLSDVMQAAMTSIVDGAPPVLDWNSVIQETFEPAEKDITHLAPQTAPKSLPDNKLSQLVDDVTSGKKLIPVVKGPIAQLNELHPRPAGARYSRDPDAPLRPQDVLPVGQFIMESLKLRRTAKDHMLEAEAERLRQEQRFIPWVGGIEVGVSMVLALKHGTVDASTVAWIHLLQGLRAGSIISIEHPVNGLLQEPIHVQSVNFYDIDKGWRDVAIMVEVSDLNVIEQGHYSTKFYVALNDDLLDEHMVPVINHEWIKILPKQE